jgi:2-phospho-L-lactate transferase/gluconeogenesis factor (CofD/UPF0052 family)
MWQPGETMNFTASDHVGAIQRHAGGGLLDYVVLNSRPVGGALRKKYARQGVLPVENDLDRLAEMGVAMVARDLLEETTKIRHSPALSAAVAIILAQEGRRRRRASSHSRH